MSASTDETGSDSTLKQPTPDDTPTTVDGKEVRPTEIGGRDGPDPTRYGDWEKAGRCIDF